jgi:hypothetical protein
MSRCRARNAWTTREAYKSPDASPAEMKTRTYGKHAIIKPLVRAVERFLAAIHRHPRWGWAGLIAYASAVTFPHEQVQLVVGKISFYTGLPGLYRISAAIAIALGLTLTIALMKQLWKSPDRRRIVAYWFLTLVLIVATWRLLTANNTELVHYPQYVPEGMALAALTFSPVESMAWVAILGGLDEGFQYAFLNTDRPVPFDFNDIYMDMLGAAIGILLAVAFQPNERRKRGRFGLGALAGIVATGVVLWALGLMRLHDDKVDQRYWFSLSHSDPSAPWLFQRAWGPNKFHELLPVEGLILIFGTIALYSALERRSPEG